MGKIKINEVGPRDGFQNHPTLIPTEIKISAVEQLLDCGFHKIEATSFVSPKALPQMADSRKVVEAVRDKAKEKGIRLTGLVVNLQGAVYAKDAGLEEMCFVVSASPKHNQMNAGMSIENSLWQIQNIRKALPNVRLEVCLATAFQCAFMGPVPQEQVLSLTEKVLDIGADSIGLADTTGAANPLQVRALLERFQEKFSQQSPIMHFHDTYGMGMANVITAIECGINEFDTSIAGMGGCPFSPGATGNIATEDLVYMANSMKIDCNVDKDALWKTLQFFLKNICNDSASHIAKTGFMAL